MLHHVMLLIQHYQALAVQLHLTTLVQNNPTLLARSSPNIDYTVVLDLFELKAIGFT